MHFEIMFSCKIKIKQYFIGIKYNYKYVFKILYQAIFNINKIFINMNLFSEN